MAFLLHSCYSGRPLFNCIADKAQTVPSLALKSLFVIYLLMDGAMDGQRDASSILFIIKGIISIAIFLIDIVCVSQWSWTEKDRGARLISRPLLLTAVILCYLLNMFWIYTMIDLANSIWLPFTWFYVFFFTVSVAITILHHLFLCIVHANFTEEEDIF